MNYRLIIKDRLADHTALAIQLLLLILGVYSVIMADENRFWKVPVLVIGLLSWFFFRDKIKHPIIWLTLLTLLLIDLYYNYFWVANHHFMLLLIVLSVISFKYHQREKVLLKNVQLLVVVVIAASVVQKFMSPQFMTGDFYYYMMNRGSLFRNFIDFFPDNVEIILENRKILSRLEATDPNLGEIIILKDTIPNLGLISYIFAWTTIAVELLVAIALLLKPKTTWTHLIFMLMILGILSTRFETGFMALLAICGLLLSKNVYLRAGYTIISIACVVLIATKIGFH